MRHSRLMSVLLAAGLLLAMWWGSLAVYDAHATQDALRALQAERAHETPFRWSFEAPGEALFGHGLKNFEWSGGTVSGDLDDPYLYLDLRGRFIDARRFDRARLRLFSPQAGFLHLFHRQVASDGIHASGPIPVSAGWQTLDLDLPWLGWREKPLFAPGSPDEPSSWGGADGVVTALRIDPVEAGAFALDWLELSSSSAPPRLAEAVEPFASLDDPLFERMRAEPDRTWLIARKGLLRTPETAHWTRRQVAAEFPSAIVFPRLPGQEALRQPAPAAQALPPALPTFAYLLGALALLLAPLLPAPWRPLLEVAGLVALVQGWVWLYPLLDTVGALALAAPLAAALVWLRPQPLAPQVLGDRRAWLAVAPLLLLALLLLWLLPPAASPEGPQTVSVPRALGLYFPWALVQQYVVAVLIQGRLRPLFGPAAVVLSAGLFGFLHFPNFALMAATFALGLVLLEVHRRFRNLPAIAAAQAFLSVSFNNLALGYFWLSREVGPAFLAAL